MITTRLVFLKIFFLLLTLFILFSNLYIVDSSKQAVSSEKGKLDLSGYHIEEQGKLTLDGEWEFYLEQFVPPVPYSGLAQNVPDVYIAPPRLWNYYEVDGKPIPGFSYGTYRLLVTGAAPDVPLAIKILPQSTAYEMYIDDKLIAGNGVVGMGPGHSSPGYLPQSVSFTPHSGEFVITIHISNFIFARGGMWDAPTLGTLNQIENLDQMVLYRDMFFEGCYFIILLMCLVIYINRPINRAWLYFALLCLTTGARITIYGTHLITLLTENYRLITFIEYSTRLWYPVLMLLLINAEFSGKLPKKLLTGLTLIITAFTVGVAVLPIHVFTAFAKGVMAYDFLVGLLMLVLILWPGERFFSMKRHAVYLCYGITAIIACAVYDMFFASTSYYEMTPIGFFIALLAFSFILAMTYADALTDCENALLELETESERKLQTELKLLQSQIRPHFLYNALSAIANVCAKDGRKAEQLILDLAYYMQTSFDFSSSEKLTTLENELEYIRKYVHIEKARFGEKIKYAEEIDVPLDTQLPRLIIEPLVENAIRHGISKKKGGGEVRLKVAEVPEGVRVEVYDNGIGMDQKKLAGLFREESRSVGLKNIQDRLLRMGGKGLNVESAANEYTEVSFVIRSVKGLC